MTYEGHSHYVMMVAFNPKDANTFASASLDRTIKVWGLGTLQPHFTLEGHEKGVNCRVLLDYSSPGRRPPATPPPPPPPPPRASSGRRRQHRQGVGLPDEAVRADDGGAHAQRRVRLLPPRAPDHHERLRGRHDQDLARDDVPAREHAQLRLRAMLVDRRPQGHEQHRHRLRRGYDDRTIQLQATRTRSRRWTRRQGGARAPQRDLAVDLNKIDADATPADGERLVLAAKELDVCEIYPQSLSTTPTAASPSSPATASTSSTRRSRGARSRLGTPSTSSGR